MNTINLNELTFENIGEWPLIIKVSLICTSAIIIIGLGYWYFVSPNIDKLYSLQTHELTLRKEFEDKQAKAAALDQYRDQLTQMQAKFTSVLKQLPAENEMPNLLENISKTGIAAGLKFELFAPQPEIKHDFYMEMPIKIRVTGTYEQLSMFLSRVAELSRIVTLHDFVIESDSSSNNKGTTANDDQLAMDITAKIYWYRAK